jgi:hypothetical protein
LISEETRIINPLGAGGDERSFEQGCKPAILEETGMACANEPCFDRAAKDGGIGILLYKMEIVVINLTN